MPQELKDYVRRHLEKRGVVPETLSNGMIKALNAFSQDEYEKTKVIDQLGAALMDESDPLPTHKKISAVH